MDDFFDGDDFSEYADDARKALSRRFGRSRASSSRSQTPAAPGAAPAAPSAAATQGGDGAAAPVVGAETMEKMEKLGEAIEQKFDKVDKAFEAGRAGLTAIEDAIGFGLSLKSAIFKINLSLAKFSSAVSGAYMWLAVLLLLFIIHQVTPPPFAVLRGTAFHCTQPPTQTVAHRVHVLRSSSCGSTRTPTWPLSARRCSSTSPKSRGT